MIFSFVRAVYDEVCRLDRLANWVPYNPPEIEVEPTVVSFRPLPTATRQPPWDPESLIVDDLGVAPRRRERRV